MKTQKGFTLVEIAIVLVIIGLLLGGVLKGKEIITNARVKNLENSVDGLAAAIYSYQDRYQSSPGDDAYVGRFVGLSNDASGNGGDGDGNIVGDFADFNKSKETSRLWLHLRNAGLVAGSIDKTKDESYKQPLNAFSGVIGAGTNPADTNGTNISTVTIPDLFVGFTKIPNDIAIILETRADDGITNSGGLQSDQTDYTDKNALHELFFDI